MCLNRVLPEKPEPKGRGWKVFRKVRSNTGTIVRDDYWPGVIGRCDPYRVGTWYDAFERTLSNEKRREDPMYQEYVSGFHVAVDRRDAEAHLSMAAGYDDVIREVEYEGAHTLGLGQDMFPGKQVIVKRMRILPESERTDFHAQA